MVPEVAPWAQIDAITILMEQVCWLHRVSEALSEIIEHLVLDVY